ncbi:hypothetical protein ABTB68_19410, partial [Acinetobacter baumannii]
PEPGIPADLKPLDSPPPPPVPADGRPDAVPENIKLDEKGRVKGFVQKDGQGYEVTWGADNEPPTSVTITNRTGKHILSR